jgi:uncharacterized membrane protein YphA (DoxX/SURF4 family)
VPAALSALAARARGARWANVCVVLVRFLVGFAFLPAGLKKVLGEPFTDPQNTGPFHDFLHAFHATGAFYRFVGVVQLAIAVLLLTQRFAAAGAVLALPVTTAIAVFCWSTHVIPTATVATLMLAAVVGLVAWDLDRWTRWPGAATPRPALHERAWMLCGAAILAVYLGACLATGEVYRPRGVRPDDARFYVFPVIALLPAVTYAVDRRWRRARRDLAAPAAP